MRRESIPLISDICRSDTIFAQGRIMGCLNFYLFALWVRFVTFPAVQNITSHTEIATKQDSVCNNLKQSLTPKQVICLRPEHQSNNRD